MERAKDIIAIGGSAGAYPMILELLQVLPPSFAEAVVIVLHRNPDYDTRIESSLSKQLGRSVSSIEDKIPIRQGGIYFAPPGYHTLVEPSFEFSLDISEPVNYSRPSIDVFFESCADVYGSACTAFLLSGANHDGAAGIGRVLSNGGQAYVQQPQEALIDTMPQFALEQNPAAQCFGHGELLDYFGNLKFISGKNEKN